MLRAGFGICVCHDQIAAREPNLVPVLADQFGFDLEGWVVMHEDLKSDQRMRRLFDRLAGGLQTYVAAGRRASATKCAAAPVAP